MNMPGKTLTVKRMTKAALVNPILFLLSLTKMFFMMQCFLQKCFQRQRQKVLLYLCGAHIENLSLGKKICKQRAFLTGEKWLKYICFFFLQKRLELKKKNLRKNYQKGTRGPAVQEYG